MGDDRKDGLAAKTGATIESCHALLAAGSV